MARFLLIILCPVFMVAAFTVIVDPYGISGMPVIKGFNDKKIGIIENTRLSKAFKVWELRPKQLIIGTSRAESGLNPYHPAWGAEHAFNLAFSNAHIHETRRYLQHALNLNTVERVVFGLDFYAFNANRVISPVFKEEYLSISGDGQKRIFPVSAYINSIISVDAFLASWKTLRTDPRKNDFFSDRGQQLTRKNAVDGSGQRAAFLACEKGFALYVWRGLDAVGMRSGYQSDYVFSNDSGSSFDDFHRIIADCLTRKVQLSMFISPTHIRHLVAMKMAGFLERYFDWKRRLVRAVAKEQKDYPDAPPVVLLDFSVANRLTTEEVPAAQDVVTRMRWYHETSHYTQEFGDIILNILLANKYPQENYGTIAVPLTAANVEWQIMRQRQEVYAWIVAHTVEYAEMLNAININ